MRTVSVAVLSPAMASAGATVAVDVSRPGPLRILRRDGDGVSRAIGQPGDRQRVVRPGGGGGGGDGRTATHRRCDRDVAGNRRVAVRDGRAEVDLGRRVAAADVGTASNPAVSPPAASAAIQTRRRAPSNLRDESPSRRAGAILIMSPRVVVIRETVAALADAAHRVIAVFAAASIAGAAQPGRAGHEATALLDRRRTKPRAVGGDHSKPNNARWCSMAVCGNRMKARRHYERTRAGR
jgi:hypothetical protein